MTPKMKDSPLLKWFVAQFGKREREFKQLTDAEVSNKRFQASEIVRKCQDELESRNLWDERFRVAVLTSNMEEINRNTVVQEDVSGE